MGWIIGIGVLVLLVGAVLLWPHPDIGRDYLPDLTRQLMVRSQNGGFVRFDDRKSDFWFSLERTDGDDVSATCALRIPRNSRVLAASDTLQNAFLSNGFEWVSEDANPSLLAKVYISVDDIWNKTSGAQGAHAIRILLNEIGMPTNARLKVERMYKESDRWKHRDPADL